MQSMGFTAQGCQRDETMKAKTMTMLGLLALSATLLAAAPVSASGGDSNCNNYGNVVNVGSTTNCSVNYQYCDQASGAGAGAGAGGVGGGQAGAKAGTSTDCHQGSNALYKMDLPGPAAGLRDQVHQRVGGL
jgi:hypothetical protein